MTTNPLLNMSPDELLSTTRSVRKRLDFSRPVEPELLNECLELAAQAPTGSNAQGWHFIVVTDPEKRVDDYPHQLSGGMRQRVMMAVALACKPPLLIADEPTTALDVTVQAQVLELLRDMKQQFDLSLLLITHDLGVIAETADRVAVMYAGRIVEQGTVRELFHQPKHPYTRGLLASIPGGPPDLADLPVGCSFGPRCSRHHAACDAGVPPLETVGEARMARCLSPLLMTEEAV